MYTKSMLGVEECQAAISAMLASFKEDPTRRPIAMAIVDDRGELLAYLRTDGCGQLAAKSCIRKAYSCAISRQNSGDYGERLKTQGRTVAESGDPMMTPVQGGLVITSADGTTLGGIGVGGLPGGHLDEEIAQVGIQALNL